jgi:hypothetical protein
MEIFFHGGMYSIYSVKRAGSWLTPSDIQQELYKPIISGNKKKKKK